MRFPHLTSWRTTATGAGALIFAAADLIVMVHNKEWDGNKLGMDILAILTGLGLVSARDDAVSVQEHHEDRVAIAENTANAVVAKQVAVVAHEEAKDLRALVESK